ncbi:MAG: type II secretion system protein [Patescibacteria group bacterium]|nr:type II secretion system protein [Patescibacteria group bacterium]
MDRSLNNGFTLIELLVVLGVIAILATVVVIVLNPLELIAEARDGQRLSDMTTMNKAIALYLADAANPHLGTPGFAYLDFMIPRGPCYDMVSTSGVWSNSIDTCSAQDWFPTATGSNGLWDTPSSTAINGTGWIPIDFADINSGSPIDFERLDPVHQAGTCNGAWNSVNLSQCALFYSYITDGTHFKLAAFMESRKYSNGGPHDVESNDGGVNPYVLETGNDLNL